MPLTVTLTLPEAAVPRVSAAFGKILRLGRDCTAAEYKQYLADHTRQRVEAQENEDRFIAAAAAAAAPIVVT